MTKAREWPRGWQMPGPRQHKCPTPGTDKAGNWSAVARRAGGGGGGGLGAAGID